jgi:zinc protease
MKPAALRRQASLAALLIACLALSPQLARAGGKAGGEAPPAKYEKVVTVEGVTEYRLPNGVRFLLFPDPSSSTVTVNMTVLVGSRHEGYGETGMAHLLEHMLFKGSKGFPNMDRALQEHGANRTADATTWVDRTNYFETMPATDKNLEFGIRFEADRLVNAFIRREDLAKEFSVVRNEFEMNENDPGKVLSQRMIAVAFEWHNYGKVTIGNRSDIERVPIDNLQAFYKKYYRPDNLVLIVAGKFDEQKALNLISTHFGALKRPAHPLPSTYTEEPAQDGERVVTLRRVGKVPLVGVMYHTPAASHPDNATMDVVSALLTSQPRGRLYKALVETKKATSVGGGNQSWHDPGVIEITATVNAKIKPEEVRDTLLDIVENFASSKITDEDVKLAKQKLLAGYDQIVANSRSLASQLSEWSSAGDWRLFFLHRDRIEKVTAEDVRKAAAKYLRRTNRTLGMYYPTTEVARTTIPPTGAVAELVKDYKGRESIAKGEAFDPTPANIEARVKRLTLPNGIKVALLPKKTRGETVVGSLVLHFGSEESLKGQTTAAGLVGPLMMRGTKKYTRTDIADQLDQLKARLNAGGGAGSLTFTFQAKRKTLPKLLDLLGEVLRNPTFPESELGILKRARRQGLVQSQAEPQPLAGNALGRHLNPYPKDSIHYAPTLQESIERLDKVTRDQVAKLYYDQIGAQKGELVLVGDFDAEAALKQFKGFLDDWKAKAPYKRIGKKAHTDTPGGKLEINTPDKENAVLVGGYLFSLTDTSPDYPAMVVGNYILGASGLNSRIFGALRTTEGLSYGAGSQFGTADPRDGYASMMVFAIVNPKGIKKADKVMREVLAKVLKEGVTEKEVAEAKKGLLQDLKVGRANDGGLAGTLRAGLELGRTMKFQQEREDRIAKLTVEDVNRALRAYLTPGRLYIIHAGDLKKSDGPGPQK